MELEWNCSFCNTGHYTCRALNNSKEGNVRVPVNIPPDCGRLRSLFVSLLFKIFLVVQLCPDIAWQLCRPNAELSPQLLPFFVSQVQCLLQDLQASIATPKSSSSEGQRGRDVRRIFCPTRHLGCPLDKTNLSCPSENGLSSGARGRAGAVDRWTYQQPQTPQELHPTCERCLFGQNGLPYSSLVVLGRPADSPSA